MRLRLPERTASRRRRGVAVVVLLLSAIPAALFGRWIFWVGVAIFAVIGIADFFMRDQPLD